MKAADAGVHRTKEIRILSCVTFKYCLKTLLFFKNDFCVTSHAVSIIAILENIIYIVIFTMDGLIFVLSNLCWLLTKLIENKVSWLANFKTFPFPSIARYK